MTRHYTINLANETGTDDDDCPWFVMSYGDATCDPTTEDHVGMLDTVTDREATDEQLIAALDSEWGAAVNVTSANTTIRR